jgi:HEAT repeat protein
MEIPVNFLKPNVATLLETGDIQALVKPLGFRSSANARHDAAEALGRVGDTRAVGPLIQASKDVNGGVQDSAVRALGNAFTWKRPAGVLSR